MDMAAADENPFYSEKVKEEIRLRRSRPAALPEAEGSGAGQDRLRGHEEVQEGLDLTIQCPPIEDGPVDDPGQPSTLGEQQLMNYQGPESLPMPPQRWTSTCVSTTFEQVPPGRWTPASQSVRQTQERFQRQMEQAVMEELYQQNDALRRELEELRRKRPKSMTEGANRPGRKSGSEASMFTPEDATPRQGSEGQCRRTTPGGTMVPLGPPPPEPSERPEVPAWLEEYYDYAEVEHELHGRLKASTALAQQHLHGRSRTPTALAQQDSHGRLRASMALAQHDRHGRSRSPMALAGTLHPSRDPCSDSEQRECGQDRVRVGPDRTQGEQTQPEVQPSYETLRLLWLEREMQSLKQQMKHESSKQPPVPPPPRAEEQPEKTEAENGTTEQLRSIPITLPKLVEANAEQAAIKAGDWLSEVRPLVEDVSDRAGWWWSQIMKIATSTYHRWLSAGPLERLRVEPEKTELVGFERLESRVVSMLLAAIPTSVKQEVISMRQVQCVYIVYKILKVYQPGGVTERSATLMALTSTKAAATASEAVDSLQAWNRHLLRARELDLTVPDPLLQVRALTEVMRAVLASDAQASFRVSTFRMQKQVDVSPSQETVDGFLQLLISEADYLRHGAAVEESKGNAKVRQVTNKTEDQREKPKGKCRHWGTTLGCKRGDQCHFQHSWTEIPDKNSRCWKCSSTEQTIKDCTAGQKRAEAAANSESKEQTNQGKSKGKGKSKSKDGKNNSGSPQVNQVTQQSASQVQQTGGSESQPVETNSGSTTDGSMQQTTSGGAVITSSEATTSESKGTDGALFSEVTSLLKALRIEPQIRKISVELEKEGVLLDSGATHILRQVKSEEEWEASEETKVRTATGTCILRQKGFTTLLSRDRVQTILPLGMLASEGMKVVWDRSGCYIKNSGIGRIPVEVHNNCPYIDPEWSDRLIQLIEAKNQRALRRINHPGSEHRGEDGLVWQVETLQRWFPNIPMNQLARLCVEDKVDVNLLPWNRRFRRSVERSDAVVLNLFSGYDQRYWSQRVPHNVQVISVDILRNQDLLDSNVMAYLASVIRTGKVQMIVGGPPCRTVSVLRMRGDGGPRQVRDRDGEGRWGSQNLTPAEKQLVEDDSQLWLRFMALVRLGRHYNQNLTGLAETPEDPAEYWPQMKHCPTFTNWGELNDTFETPGWQRITVEQGALGHPRRKPTCLWTDIPEVLQFHGLRSAAQTNEPWPTSVPEAVQASKKLASWAPMLKEALIQTICRTSRTCSESSPEVRAVRRHKEEELRDWYLHLIQGHLPYRRDCAQCVLGAGRDRRRSKVQNPEAWVLSMDIAGPFRPGRDQKGHPKYFMIGVLTVPKCIDRPLVHGWKPKETDGEVVTEDVEMEQWDILPEEASPNPFAQSQEAPHHEQSQPKDQPQPLQPLQQPEPCEGEDSRDSLETEDQIGGRLEVAEILEEEIGRSNFVQKMNELKQVNVMHLSYAVPLMSRKETHVLEAVETLYNKFKVLDFPVRRIHVDRAKEFTPRFEAWIRKREITLTQSVGDEPTNNARAEIEVNVLKNATRVMLKSADVQEEYWPLALRQAAEERHRGQLRQMGLSLKRLVPFGAEIMVKRKTWHRRGEPWRWPMTKAKALGPAQGTSSTTAAYWVQADDKFFRTTVVVRPTFNALAEQGAGAIDNGAHGADSEDEFQGGDTDDYSYEPAYEGDDPLPPGAHLAEMEESALPDRPRWRFHGKHAMGPDGAPGGESLRSLRIPEARRVHEGDWECENCGLRQVKATRECEFCETGSEERGWSEELIVKQIEELNKEEMTCEIFMAGLQKLLSDEVMNGMQLETLADSGGWMEQFKTELRELQGQSLGRRLCVAQTMEKLNQDQEKKGVAQEAEVLQTYVVGTQQILSEKELWIEPIQGEIKALMDTSTLREVSPDEVRKLHETGAHVELIPGKLICTRKAPNGRRRARIVGCGNFGTPDGTVSTSTGGLDSISLRTMLMLASQSSWSVGSIDVKSAFLQAPKRSRAFRTTLVRPPKLVTQLGLIKGGTWWEATGALYGLRESPEDWTQYRNHTMRGRRWKFKNVELHLEQLAEANIWKVTDGEHNTWGFVGTYVDDIVVMGGSDVTHSVLDHFAKTWECSPKEVLDEEGQELKFCGFHIHRMASGYIMHQKDYIMDMCNRNDITREWTGGGHLITAVEDEDEKFSAQDLRAAQAAVGELQWVSTRTRPDITHGLGLLSRWMHRRPVMVLQQSKKIMEYLKATADYSLEYHKVKQGDFGKFAELDRPKGINHVEAYCDASYAPALEGYKSVQGTVICVADCPLLWTSTRQPFVVQSTAEAELLSYMEGYQQTESITALLAAMDLEPTHKCIYGDNRSALGLCEGDAGAWRTRHLRLRAAGIREAVACEKSGWRVQHLPGKILVADGLTKLLGGSAFTDFVYNVKVRKPEMRKHETAVRSCRMTFWPTLRGATLVCLGMSLLRKLSDLVRLVGLILLIVGLVVWVREMKNHTRWTRENEPVPVGVANTSNGKRWTRENEPVPVGVANTSNGERRTRENEPVPVGVNSDSNGKRWVRDHEPTPRGKRWIRENEPIPGIEKSTNLCPSGTPMEALSRSCGIFRDAVGVSAMEAPAARMLRVEADAEGPWKDPEFSRRPQGSKDRWVVQPGWTSLKAEAAAVPSPALNVPFARVWRGFAIQEGDSALSSRQCESHCC